MRRRAMEGFQILQRQRPVEPILVDVRKGLQQLHQVELRVLARLHLLSAHGVLQQIAEEFGQIVVHQRACGHTPTPIHRLRLCPCSIAIRPTRIFEERAREKQGILSRS